MYFALIKGVLKFPLFAFGSASIRSTAAQTNTKANKVPIEQASTTNSKSVNKIGTPTTNPVKIVAKEGVLNFG